MAKKYQLNVLLAEANFPDATLSGATLGGANLSGANLSVVSGLNRQQIQHVRLDLETRLPAYLDFRG